MKTIFDFAYTFVCESVKLGELVLVGLGLNSERDISMRGLEELKTADAVFAELYTNFMPELSIRRLEKQIGKKIQVLSRRTLEEEKGQVILEEAKRRKTVLLVPGDPLIATTHVDLRIRAEKQGVKTRVTHGASIISAAIGLSGLQNYKFGRSVTISFPEQDFIFETPYEVILQNKEMGLHTLCFLDVRVEEKRCMTIKEGLQVLLAVEEKRKQGLITPTTLVVGIARAGSDHSIVKAEYLETIINYDFGTPPHTLIFPAKLHFMEAEALITLAGAPENIRKIREKG